MTWDLAADQRSVSRLLKVSGCARSHTGGSGLQCSDGVGHAIGVGEGEDLDDFLRSIDACRLSVGDEKKAVGKALLGLGSRISV